jgi:hypothetical protein
VVRGSRGRATAIAISVALIALTSAGCSGGDDGAGDDVEPPATDASPSTPEPLPDEDDADGATDAADADDGTTDATDATDADGVDADGGTDGQDGEATVEVFFTNPELGPDDEVFPVERTVALPAVLRGALEELLAGPTPEEEADGYFSFFSTETADQLDDVVIEDGVAEVSFSSELPEIIPNASTSAGSAALLAALDATATQFDTVDEAVYSLEGDVDAFFEWLQLGPPG